MLLNRSHSAKRTALGAVFISLGCIVFFLSKILTISSAVSSLPGHVSNRRVVEQAPLELSRPPSLDDDDDDDEVDADHASTHDVEDYRILDSLYAEDFRADEDGPGAQKHGDDVLEAEPLLEAEQKHGGTSNDDKEGSEDDENDDDDEGYSPLPDGIDYRELFSLSTADRKYIPIFTGGAAIYNPNIIPHPTDHDLWIIVGQHEQSGKQSKYSEQLTCTGGIMNGVMICTAEPTVLPVDPSINGVCEGELAYFNFRPGPRDARMFLGPDAPYIVYGSQSAYTCLGIWLEDVRMLLQDYEHERDVLPKLFTHATELQRPPPVKAIEKNFFLFWDSDGKAYAHHDIYPQRVFAQLSYDGSVGPDLALESAHKDNMCLTTYMPTLAPEEESIHQASNSLSITMCKRKDPECVPDATNTFIFTVFHHKSFHDWHGIYEPYVMMFQQTAPFAVHAISQRPLWIHGRTTLTKDTHAMLYENEPNKEIPANHTEMFYVTSVSWKTHGQKYHGYLDDPLFLGFGIEDTRAGIMDVFAEDLFQDLGFCV
jgi:hypothetical protein